MLKLEEAIEAVGKKLGSAAFHDAMGGGPGIGRMSEAEILRLIYGGKQPSHERLRQTAKKEERRLFEEQHSRFAARRKKL